MASVTVEVPDDQAARIIAAFAAERGVEVADLSDGVELVKTAVFAFLRDRTLLHEARISYEAVLTNGDDPLVNATVSQVQS